MEVVYASPAQPSVADLTVGYSEEGYTRYLNSINEYMDLIEGKIENTADMFSAIQSCWSGSSCDDFVKVLRESIEDLKKTVHREYATFYNRALEIKKTLQEQDENLRISM